MKQLIDEFIFRNELSGLISKGEFGKTVDSDEMRQRAEWAISVGQDYLDKLQEYETHNNEETRPVRPSDETRSDDEHGVSHCLCRDNM